MLGAFDDALAASRRFTPHSALGLRLVQSGRHLLCRGHAPDLMSLKGRQHLPGKAANLLDEHLMRHGPAIETDLHEVTRHAGGLG